MKREPAGVVLNPWTFYMSGGSSLHDVAERVGRLDAGAFRTADGFVFLCRDRIPFDGDAAAPLLGYAAGKPVVILSHDRDGSICADLVNKNGLNQIAGQATTFIAREADLLRLLHDGASACKLEAGGNFHFVTPSLVHTDTFIRIGDLLRDLPTLDRFAFWLRPYAERATAVIADSWSISSAVLRTIQSYRLTADFDCLPEHPTHNVLACRRLVEAVVARLPENARLVAFISICGSGRLREQLFNMVREVSGRRINFECHPIYGLPGAPADVAYFARIRQAGVSFDQDNCDLCKSGSVTIRIDPSSYHLRHWKERTVNLTKLHCRPGRSFIERYRNVKGLFCVHRNDRNDGRHHAYDLEIPALLSDETFNSRLANHLQEARYGSDLIVAPSHSPGRSIAAIVARAIGCPTLIHDSLAQSEMSSADTRALSNAKRLLIVDDVANTGSRLRRYVQSLREGPYGAFDRLDYLVAVARPASADERGELAASISAGHGWAGSFHAVEEILLPDSTRDCPWCAEFDCLSRIARQSSRPAQWLVQRLSALRARDDGISGEPLLLLPGVNSVPLGRESVICSEGASSMVTLFAVASALQSLRNDPDVARRLKAGFPLSNVIATFNVSKRYTEGLIRAVILRLVSRSEWGQEEGHRTLAALSSEVVKPSQRILGGELLLALSRAALPPMSRGSFVATFGKLLGPDIGAVGDALFMPR